MKVCYNVCVTRCLGYNRIQGEDYMTKDVNVTEEMAYEDKEHIIFYSGGGLVASLLHTECIRS